ncbi:MAG: dihydrolipoyl dehydrogenase, partial [Planctomycetes bacterium]|nr:dihydrolipoyl dehydrogenase [Planctomycetota bacterium]
MADNAASTRVVVVGAGPGGYAAAFHAADLGMQVTLVDPEEAPGGVCLYRGCIPSKALLHVARLLNETRDAAECGLRFTRPLIDVDQLRTWKQGVVSKLTGGLAQLSRKRNITQLHGRAKFIEPTRLVVKPAAGGAEQSVEFDFAIVSTGSRPATLPAAPAIGGRIMDSTSALELEDVPKSLLVVGGGYIGLELSTVYAALGSKVTIVEMTNGLLPGADRDLVDVLHKRLRNDVSEILLNTRVAEMTESPDKQGVRVKLMGIDMVEPVRTCSRVLVSVGRKPNSEGLGLENTRAKTDARGFIQVDGQRRTAEPTIFAIGDVVGEPMLAHKASHEARVAVEVIAGKSSVFEPQAIPAVVFTDPEVAWCGLTETSALAGTRPFKVLRFPWGASGRAATLARSDGLTKLVVDPRTERVLGVGIVGPGAGELIAEG